MRRSGAGVADEVAVDAAEPVRDGVVRERVAEVLGADLADPLVVLVLVVDERGRQVVVDDGQLGGGTGVSGGAVADAGVDALGDGACRDPARRDRRTDRQDRITGSGERRSPMSHRDGHDVIVIGTGASGLAAAGALHAAGRDTLRLEARDRIGGACSPYPPRTRTGPSTWGPPGSGTGRSAYGLWPHAAAARPSPSTSPATPCSRSPPGRAASPAT